MKGHREDQLLGELKEFKEWSVREITEMKQDVKGLLHFKWRAVGALSLVVIFVEVGFKILEISQLHRS